MDEYMKAVLQATILGSHRQDEIVARQGVMNHQTSAHLMDLTFLRDATEMSIPESYAVQGLANSQTPRDASMANLARQTPGGAEYPPVYAKAPA